MESVSRKTVALFPVNARIGGKQVSKVIVALQRKRQFMVHVKSPIKRPSCPDTFLKLKIPVNPPGVIDISFA
jgi:hypothetical protein